MDLQTALLVVIAGSLLWGLVLAEPLRWLVRRWRHRAFTPREQVLVPRVLPEESSMSLVLCSKKGEEEHEISFHGTDAPETYSYAGKLYRQERRRHRDGAHARDIVWEYRRA